MGQALDKQKAEDAGIGAVGQADVGSGTIFGPSLFFSFLFHFVIKCMHYSDTF